MTYRRTPSGEKRHWVWIKRHKIESSSTAVDAYGQLSTSSTALVNVTGTWAKIEQLNGTELEVARQIYPQASYQITIDYSSTLDSTGATRREVEYNNRIYHIGAIVNPDLENIEMQLLCGTEA